MGQSEAASVERSLAIESTPAPRALLSPGLDFWTLGGASLVVWVALVCVEGLRSQSWAVYHQLDSLVAASAMLAVLVNYPHFMASYKLAYGRGGAFVLRYWYQLIAVPIGLMVLLGAGAWLYLQPGVGQGFFDMLHRALTGLGLDTRIGTAPTAGRNLMSLTIGFMYFTVGWHYSKQAYGCMMVYANFDGYKLSPPQRTALRWALFSVWAVHFCYLHTATEPGNFFGVSYFTLGLPGAVYPCALVACAAAFLVVVHVVFVPNYRLLGRRPSATFLIPYVAFAFWWVPPLQQREFIFYLVPFFHSLQYLTFVSKVERARLSKTSPAGWSPRAAMIVVALVAVGFLAFELVPDTVDTLARSRTTLGLPFFIAAATIFINVHHYFIDNAIWRFDQREVREYLLG
jgi:hypothetical protein